MMLIPYPHQNRAIDLTWQFFQVNRDKNAVVLEAPCAAGKSLIQAESSKKICLQKHQAKVICLVHVYELVEQNYEAMLEQWPENAENIGVNCATAGRRDLDKQITFCSIQSVYKHAYKFGTVTMLFIDECHLISEETESTYRAFISQLLDINPHLKIVGLSGTPYRLKGGLLIEGEDALFQHLIPAKACDMEMGTLTRLGFLCPLVTPNEPLETVIDTSEVNKSCGDFTTSGLEKAISEQNITYRACKEALRLAKDRHSWLVFGVSIDDAHHIQDCLAALGEPAEVVHSKVLKKERKKIIQDQKDGLIRILISVNVITIGFNSKRVDCIVNLAPTDSPGRYVQKGGRGQRVHFSKSDCLFLDFSGDIERHGPIDNVNIPKRIFDSRLSRLDEFLLLYLSQ